MSYRLNRLVLFLTLLISTLEGIEDYRYFNFVLDPNEITSYRPKEQVIGPIMKLPFKEGEAFKKGDLLLQMDPTDFEAEVLSREANLEKAYIEYQTRKRLFEDKNGSYLDYINAKSALENAKSELVIAKNNLADTTIFAPYDGKVSLLTIKKWEVPIKEEKMIDIIDDSKLIGKILIPAKLSSIIQVGDSVELKIQDVDEVVTAKIARIGAVIDPVSSTLKIEVEIENSDGKLKAGMNGKAYLVKSTKSKSEGSK